MNGNGVPLLSFEPGSLRPISPRRAYDDNEDDDRSTNRKRWYHYLPLLGAILLILMPHPSLMTVFIHYHLLILHSKTLFLTHLSVTYALTFLAFTSLIVCVARDPGPIPDPKSTLARADMTLEEALLTPPPDDDYTHPGKWCRVCWAPKPERAHHCSQCGRCVLKMDHHCPWMGAKCIGHRTYAPFIHFLASVTLLSLYTAGIAIEGLWFAFHNALTIDETTPLHMLFLAFAGLAFGMIIGSFLTYHIYLTLTNQTTIESGSAFHLLRHLPPLSSSRLSNPPYEHELSYPQRRLVRAAHGSVRLYDLGWRKNWAQVFKPGWRTWIYGGSCPGDGQKFPRNPRADEMLSRLASDLVKLDQEA
ncbi:zf-DHHC-domain-containing protein [Artomyces pyxidatus]|uniref:Zf-DHHC-domain-containing protein n=1 Tax=Artomyces pyxidatus TaxID=48021 RepID=A0ACB8SUN2_9AGAM|nr:zf-DHHC-domain-containing protein [Artomyces pyxidatus]